jgi:NAD(P)-dependent dehydrogenase (short-subunit alcohol dehydrogenase family)
MSKLIGNVAVTGGSTGIGLATARLFAAEGESALRYGCRLLDLLHASGRLPHIPLWLALIARIG